jgi:L-ribulose-5-phosphate 4-epimerase
MTFEPTLDALMPDLNQEEELTILARALWRAGYNDHIAGHISVNLHDGTLLCNPYPLLWSEFRPQDVIRIDLDGNLVSGNWKVPPGITLHLALHRARPEVEVAMHNHPWWGTVWADMQEVPPALDQSSVIGGGRLTVVDEFDGTVNEFAAAAATVRKIGDADLALLTGHGSFVLGSSVRSVYQRAIALEIRCRRAWCVRAAGSSMSASLPDWYLAQSEAMTGEEFSGYWEAAVRRELADAPSLLAGRVSAG